MIAELLANPTFVGASGAIVLGAVLWSARGLAHIIPRIFTSLLTSQIELTSEYQHYRKITDFTGRYRVSFAQRNYALRSGMYESDTVSNYNPALGFGITLGRYQGCWFAAELTLHTSGTMRPYETLKLTFLTRRSDKIYAFIKESLQGLPDALNVIVHLSDHESLILHKPRRSFDKIYLTLTLKQGLIGAFEKFGDTQAWYRSHGIPYKFGVLLYGEPGCGKTSLIYALASRFSFNIVSINAINSLYDAIANYTPDTLLVIEDIDALINGLDRENDDKFDDKAPNLHKLLNVFDGALTPHGFKFVVTTNYIEKLDAALLRPGRFDLKLEIGHAPEEEIARMYQDFYGVKLKGVAPAMRGCEAQALFVGKSAGDAAIALKTRAFDNAAAGL